MQETAANPGLVQIGETLRTARELRGLSLDQAAATLRCDARVIDALEHGRFEDLGPPVFARGHLLRYATLLGEPGEAMVEEWSQLAAGGAGAELMYGLQGPRGRDLRQVRRRLVTAAAFLSFVAIAVWSLQNLPKAKRATDSPAVAAANRSSSAPLASPARPAREGLSVNAVAPPVAPVTSASPEVQVIPPPAAAAPVLLSVAPMSAQPSSDPPAPQAALPRGVVRLGLAFSADSWLEIYDSRNRRLFFGVARPGAPVDVRGPAPLRVIVGNALAATLQLNGRPVEVPGEAMRGPRAAALRVNADGRLIALPRA